jgi:hypothetical protein
MVGGGVPMWEWRLALHLHLWKDAVPPEVGCVDMREWMKRELARLAHCAVSRSSPGHPDKCGMTLIQQHSKMMSRTFGYNW